MAPRPVIVSAPPPISSVPPPPAMAPMNLAPDWAISRSPALVRRTDVEPWIVPELVTVTPLPDAATPTPTEPVVPPKPPAPPWMVPPALFSDAPPAR